ncbi:unnamed protein product [Moneuplotes crassus]|uniref:Partial AB-hydrolase lipase domain-containing protein n=1 Tax=Euplotes crassus TaxID=5936 RepID=A0AAD1Y448_EUPCR|nr:unnamed protein product [Moneuplotes crassus]
MKTYKFILLLTLILSVQAQRATESLWDIQQRCEQYGYPYEEHQVTTEDGYILTLMRIPHGREDDNMENREPVYMTHPISSSAESFTYLGPENSPVFYIVNNGYDVWLNNFRGNIYSRNHEELDFDTERKEFYDLDLIDLSQDHPANIQYIIDTTGYPQIHTFCFSLSGVALAINMAIRPEFYESRLSEAVLIASPINMANTNSPTYAILGNNPWIFAILRNLGIYEIFDRTPFHNLLMSIFCAPFAFFCITSNEFTEGNSIYEVDNPRAYALFMARGGMGMPRRALEHLVQSVRTQQVTYFDFGVQENMERYGTELPPRIPFENTRCPIAMLYGERDLVGDLVDAHWYADQIEENIIFFDTYPYAHYSFLLARDPSVYLDDILDIYGNRPISKSEESG